MNNTMNSTMQKIPGIGDIPILGLLFKSKAAQKNQTELVVMITPQILPNNSPGVTPNLPRLDEPYLPPLHDRAGGPDAAAGVSVGAVDAAGRAGRDAAAAAPRRPPTTTPSRRGRRRDDDGDVAGTRTVVPRAEPGTGDTPAAAAGGAAPQTAADSATRTPPPRSARPRSAHARKSVKQSEVARSATTPRRRSASRKQAEQDRREQKLEDERQASAGARAGRARCGNGQARRESAGKEAGRDRQEAREGHRRGRI